ncbi:MAG: hypothetical protein MUC36_26405 [Planctomycetes bacterium]|jgi:hypothetical protein|nr:hypothetical protein [Planctomycetota bacterium]
MQIEHDSYRAAMTSAEREAGNSPADYLRYLEALCHYQMRVEALVSLKSGEAVLVTSRPGTALFGDRPYLLCFTGDTIDGFRASAAVPMALDSPVASMQREIIAERNRITSDYITVHNLKPIEERLSASASWKSGKGLPGLAKFITDIVGHRLAWTDDYFLELQH